ncbi:unnamed protein product [Ceutorhynchus assimilis]|uniref:Major facilitator superfamily (MFS) profile domain-containing protein n=1 Tax=Ceutorhynchus assimilis TaxID=467358 RepID=A0A9N9MUQ9_9CUCU|nr:unnamed protein product [Ceutorhynchus assimilis]
MKIFFGNWRFYAIVVIVNFISILAGVMLTWPSPVLPKLLSNTTLSENPLGRLITTQEKSWIAALASLGGIFGPPLTGFVMEKFGRKLAIATVHLPNMFSGLMAAFGKNVWWFYVARFVGGMGSHSAIAMGAIYFGEIGKSHNRGMLFTTTSISINLGALLSYCVGPYTSIQVFNLIIFAIALVGFFGTLLYVPESPYFLLQKGRIEAARQSIEIFKGSKNVQSEIKEIEDNIAKTRHDGLLAIFQTNVTRRAFLMALLVVALSQCSGVNVIYSFTELIFEESGSTYNTVVSAILVGVAQLLTVFITTFGIDKLGRKKMMVFSSTGLAFTLGILATYFRFKTANSDNIESLKWLPIACLMCFVCLFNSGMGGVPFLYMGEILPLNVKSVGSATVMATFCFIGFLLIFFFSDVTASIGTGGGFYLFAGAMAFMALYTSIWVVETKGKTLQEIHDCLDKSEKTKSAFPA